MEPDVRTDTRLAKIALRLWPLLPGDAGRRFFMWALLRSKVTVQYPDRPSIDLGTVEDQVQP